MPLSPRPRIKGPKGERHPARRHRLAKLSFAAVAVDLPRTKDAAATASATLPVNVVHVFEKHPPPGEPAVEWFLLTDLPVDNPDAIAFVVDCYRGRWIIEEYFKALKTGCQYCCRAGWLVGMRTGLLMAIGVLHGGYQEREGSPGRVSVGRLASLTEE